MHLTESKKVTRIEASSYTAEVSEEYIDIIIAGERVSRLSPVSEVNVLSGGEKVKDQTSIVSFAYSKGGRDVVFTWTASSSLWGKKEFILRACETRLEYFVKVAGSGAVDSVEYFLGEDGHGSEYEFDTGFTPIPTVDGASQCVFSAQKSFDDFSFLTIPPLFSYIFDVSGMDKKLAFALAADAGEHNFTKFTYNTATDGSLRRFFFATDQCGHTKVDGIWTSPCVMIWGASSRERALKYYADVYFATGRAKVKDRAPRPRFWYGPIACGWIEQAAYSYTKGLGISQPEMARQELYDNFNRELERHDLHPTLMIIDDKWQTSYGDPWVNTDKWPDIRGWIDSVREKYGRHTMLWYKLWDSEGLPDDECMASDGEYCKRCADPTNPKYRARLRESMHRLLSADDGCYNADGLKIDFAFFQPTGSDAVSYSGKYGVELYLEYIKTIYEFAKEFKPDAVISASACHPLFAPYIDHARLHDYHPDLRRCPEEFSFRKMLYNTALPWSLVDTDGAAFRTHRDTMRYFIEAPQIGIPDIYCISDMPSLHLTDEDFACVANIWREYSDFVDRIAEKR